MPSDTWTVKAALEWTQEYLQQHGDDHARLSAQMLLGDVTGLSRIELYMDYERPLTVDERAAYREAIKRRVQGEPVQYITGEAAFRTIAVKVEPGVLIPRPETEVLVQAVIDRVGNGETLIADICSGSGCIACALATELPDARVIATDISEQCVALTLGNAEVLGLCERIEVLQGDLCRVFPDELRGAFDAIVSNPPYIPHALLSALPAEVKDFEPMLALDGGGDGLAVFRELCLQARQWLKDAGLFAVELHEECLDEARVFAQETGYTDCEIIEDLAGKPRALVCRKA